MARHTHREQTLHAEQQAYDTVLKSMLEGHEQEVLPHSLAGVSYQETLTIETLRTPLRVDRVYRVAYRQRPHILHIEFESGTDHRMGARLLNYHAYFHQKYELPVISIIVYPFPVKTVVSPYQEWSGEEELVTFRFQVIVLWQREAQTYVAGHHVSMYALLPVMRGASASLLLQAIEEMLEYYQNDQVHLAQQLKWFSVLLRRSETIMLEEKEQVLERVSMWNDLLENDPYIQKLKAESEARGEARGEKIGEVKALQRIALSMVRGRFPELTELAQERVSKVASADQLELVIEMLVNVQDETTARMMLQALATR
ncbi:MAG: hypothetical protein J2P37_09880 [Ktedonobacteraceae bacterium]|nr:hypothetical protein [Ktedonobacteraceae bacterium]